jgi:hypothetical protein
MTRYEIRDIDQTAEIAALKAERDDLLSANKLLHGTIDSYETEHSALRTALEAINRPFDQTMTGIETANLLRDIARRALEK